MQSNHPERIRPADFQSPLQTETRGAEAAVQSANQRATRPLMVLGILILLALATLFYLPGQIGSPSPVMDSDGSVTAVAPPPAELPFADSQLLQAHVRDAQEILADFIRTQGDLEKLEVGSWAFDAYQALLEDARQGDLHYQAREFDQALMSYRAALQSAQGLLDQRPEQAAALVKMGAQAFAAGESAAAAEAYRLALLLQPDNEEAKIGVERSAVLDEVNALKKLARESALTGNWENTRNLLTRALALDERDEDARHSLLEAETQLTQLAFRQHLAAGFNALADADYSGALESFRTAELIPDHPAVRDALVQVESAAELNRRNVLLDQAVTAEAAEDWASAVAYGQLLEREPGHVEARIGLLRSQARAELDAAIQAVLENPLSLQADAAWNEAERLLGEARNLADKTPRLVRQIDQLETTIQRARTPVELTLLSDGLTQIEIYRVGRLGSLREHRVNIYPGEYVVIGRRSGYRDVRETLRVTGTAPAITLRIEAKEAIN